MAQWSHRQRQSQFSDRRTKVLEIATVLLANPKTAQQPARSFARLLHRAWRPPNDRRPHATTLRTGIPSKELILLTQLIPAQDLAPIVPNDDSFNLAKSTKDQHGPRRTNQQSDVQLTTVQGHVSMHNPKKADQAILPQRNQKQTTIGDHRNETVTHRQQLIQECA